MHCTLEILTFDPLNFARDHSNFNASIQEEEFISALKDSADYYIQQQSLNNMYMMKHQIFLNFVLLSLTELYLQQNMQASC